jgi:hypothetical protein
MMIIPSKKTEVNVSLEHPPDYLGPDDGNSEQYLVSTTMGHQKHSKLHNIPQEQQETPCI